MTLTMRYLKAAIVSLSVVSFVVASPSYAEKKVAKKKGEAAKVVQSPATAKKETPQKTAAKDSGPMAMGNFGDSMGKEPTYIKSDSLSLRAKDRVFVYTGNVEVVQGDMTLTADTIEGTYNDQNKIDTLTAKVTVHPAPFFPRPYRPCEKSLR
jgi:lipopolysaccharide assembly outer membrane protein LptD (OstA)